MPSPELSPLQQRMADLKSKHDHKVRSDDKTPTPLSAFLRIYLKAEHECYIDYMRGARLLADYLSPIEIPATTPFPHVPQLFRTYDIAELAAHLATDRNDLAEVRAIENAMIITYVESVRT